jgi:hypothetical protein
MKKIGTKAFICWALGIALIFGNWILRIAPFWDDRQRFSDNLYNTMWNLTGVMVGVGAWAMPL